MPPSIRTSGNPLPSTCAEPWITTASVTTGSALAGWMTSRARRRGVVVSAPGLLLASVIAWRSDPGPVSAVVVTVEGGAEGGGRTSSATPTATQSATTLAPSSASPRLRNPVSRSRLDLLSRLHKIPGCSQPDARAILWHGPGAHRPAFATRSLPAAARAAHGAASRTRRAPALLDGTLVSVDISGFTALAERLAAKGKAGSRGARPARSRRVFDRADRGRRAARRRRPEVPRRRAAPALPRTSATPHARPAPPPTCSGRSSRLARLGRASSCGCRPASTRAPATSSSPRRRTASSSSPGLRATRVFELEDLATAGEIVAQRRDGGRGRSRVAARGTRGSAPDAAARARREHDASAARRPRPTRSRANTSRTAARAPCRRERRGRAPPRDRRIRQARRHGRLGRRGGTGRAARANRRRSRPRSAAPARPTASRGSSPTSTSEPSSST